jgi:hypothetical protein
MSWIENEMIGQRKDTFVHGSVEFIGAALLEIGASTAAYQHAIAREDTRTFVPDKRHATYGWKDDQEQTDSRTDSLTIGMSRRRSAFQSHALTLVIPITDLDLGTIVDRSTYHAAAIGQ